MYPFVQFTLIVWLIALVIEIIWAVRKNEQSGYAILCATVTTLLGGLGYLMHLHP